MNPFLEILDYILQSLVGLYITVIMVRFVFQLVKADFYNPVSQGIVKLTSPLLIPIRRVIPSVFGLDTASIILALVLNILLLSIHLLFRGANPLVELDIIAIIAFLKILASLFNIFTFCLLVSIILSFVAPMSMHPVAILINQVAEPLMAPFRKLLPPMGGLDISPIFVFIALNVLARIFAIAANGLGIPVQMMWMFIFVLP